MKKSVAISLLLTVITTNSVFAGEIDWENSWIDTWVTEVQGNLQI